MPSIDGRHAFWCCNQATMKSVISVRSRCISSGLVRIAIRNSVVPMRKLAILSGPRETANRIECPASSMAFW